MYASPDIQGWMSDPELLWLYDAAAGRKKIVEIGCWKGRSTHALCSGCTDGTVFAVDHFRGNPSEIDGAHAEAKTTDIFSIFLDNTKDFENLIILRKPSAEAARMFKRNSIDMVFIDGEHTYEAFKEDFETWLPLCSGLFCGHDANMEGPEKYLREQGIKFIQKESIWILCRE
jgi:predicted O-methyltransferase YrrM